jgi:hypothetical protein
VEIQIMPIEITDRYKLIFEEHHYASDFRAKIIQAWCLFYAALAAGLGWTQASTNTKPVSWILTAFAFVITLFMWAADFRHRTALTYSKRIGKAIEESAEAGIPEDQRFFASIKSRWLTHSLSIDMLTGLMLRSLWGVSNSLRASGGNLNSLTTNLIWWAISGSALGACFYLVAAIYFHLSEIDWTSRKRRRAAGR